MLEARQHYTDKKTKMIAATAKKESINKAKATWTVRHVLQATAGRLSNDMPLHMGFTGVSTDSRTINPGELFVALSGDSHDGHVFINQAVAKGAAGLLVNNKSYRDKSLKIKPSLPTIMVDDSLRALGDLAAYRRQQMKNLQVIAITGSCGKTTVKEMTAAIVSQKYRTIKSKGNFNNLVGLPLSLLPVDQQHEVAILEMGMNETGEIARLAEIADPDISCIVNVQQAHLAGLKNIKGVAAAKNELYAGTKAGGRLVINLDDPMIRKLARQHHQTRTTFAATPVGRRWHADLRATHIKSLGEAGMAFTLHADGQNQRVKINSFGLHSVANSLTAAAITYCLGMGLEEINRGLGSFKPFQQRLETVTLPSGIKILHDSYNANPGSMTAALNTVSDLKQNCKAVAVLGDMLELGQASNSAHRAIGRTVSRLGLDSLAAIGDFAGDVVDSARSAGMPAKRAKIFKTHKEIADWIEKMLAAGELSAGDWLLIKGSRGMRMEKVLAALQTRSKQ